MACRWPWWRWFRQLTEEGAVECWGNNNSGQLGDGTTGTNSTTPVPVTGLSSGVAAIAAGGWFNCALTEAGGVFCWGENGSGQLGDGTTGTNRSTPVAVTGLSSGVAAISGSGEDTCALTEAGAVECWGNNSEGQLGNGTMIPSNSTVPVPVPVLSSGAVAIAVGGGHARALIAAGAVKCWGGNSVGQLGDGTTTNRTTPVAVSGLSGATMLSTRGGQTCVLTGAGAVECWGFNDHGQLGDGTTTNRTTPVTVLGQPQTITFPAPGSHTVGDADLDPGATASSGLAVTYVSQTPAVCTIVAGQVHLLAAGDCELSAEQAGDSDYAPAAPVRRSFAVAPAAQKSSPPPPLGPPPPRTTAIPAPKVFLRHKAGGPWRFVFTDAAHAVVYRCSLDGGKVRRCRSPKTYQHLKPGRHVFRLEAEDAAGDVSPAKVVKFVVTRLSSRASAR